MPILLIIIATALIVLLVGYAGTERWGQELFIICTGIMAATFLIRRSHDRVGAVPILVGLVSLLGGLQLVFLGTEYRFATLDSAELWAAYAAFAYLCYIAVTGDERRNLGGLIYALGTLTCVFGLLHFWTCGGYLLWTGSTEFGPTFAPFINRDHFGAFCELIIPFALYRLVHSETPVVHGMAASILMAGIVASASRISFAILLAEVTAFSYLYRKRGRVGLLTAGFLVGSAALVIGSPEPLLRKFRASDTTSARLQMAKAAWRMGLEKPITGHGLGTFEVAYPRFATFDSGSRVDHAHNDFLEWFAEGGAGLAICMIIFLLVSIKHAMRAPWIMGVPAVLIHGIFDFPWRIPAIVAFSLAIVATAYPLRSSASSKTRVKKSLDVGEQPI